MFTLFWHIKYFSLFITGQDIFITTKLPPWGNNPQRVQRYLKKSLELLQLDYLDLYLVHVPFAFEEKEGEYMFATNPDGTVVFDPDVNHIEVWKVRNHHK